MDETTKMIFDIYKTLASPETFKEWMDKKIPAFNFKTPREMIAENKINQIVEVLQKLLRGGYM